MCQINNFLLTSAALYIKKFNFLNWCRIILLMVPIKMKWKNSKNCFEQNFLRRNYSKKFVVFSASLRNWWIIDDKNKVLLVFSFLVDCLVEPFFGNYVFCSFYEEIMWFIFMQFFFIVIWMGFGIECILKVVSSMSSL